MRLERSGDGARVRRGRIARLAAAVLSVAALLCSSTAPAGASPRRVVDLPVAFKVANTDTSGVPCESDGNIYTVRGHLVGPRTALRGPRASAVGLYLTGFEEGEWTWHLTEAPRYDWGVEMAKLGEASVTIDMLGYGASDRPDGSQICLGSQADITHQIIDELRSGSYTIHGRARKGPVAFSKVVLVARDIAGAAAENVAYSYKDIDGLILMTWADQGFTPEPFRLAAKSEEACANGGEQGHGYVHFAPREETYWREKLFLNPEQSVFRSAFRLRNPNPCGYFRGNPPSFIAMPVAARARDGQIHVPVLLVFGNNDQLIWTRQGEEQQRGNYTGSSDVRTVFIPKAAHFVNLERTVPTLRAVVSGWLRKRGLVASPCRHRRAPGRARR